MLSCFSGFSCNGYTQALHTATTKIPIVVNWRRLFYRGAAASCVWMGSIALVMHIFVMMLVTSNKLVVFFLFFPGVLEGCHLACLSVCSNFASFLSLVVSFYLLTV